MTALRACVIVAARHCRGAGMETGWDDGEIPSVRRLARQLITEFGEQAPAMARAKAQQSRTQDEARTWLRVLDAIVRLSPGQTQPR